MLIGQSLLANTDTEGGYEYFGPWGPRRGNAATFIVETMIVPAGVTVEFKVQQKNTEEADSAATDVFAYTTVGSTGTAATGSKAGGDLEELVRYVYRLTSSSGISWAHLRANPPIWQPN